MVRGYTSTGYENPDDIPQLFGEHRRTTKNGEGKDPGHLHVDTAGDKSGVMAGFVQMLQGNLGPGILTLPYVFTQGGVIITSAMLILVLLLTLYSMTLVLRAKRWVHAMPKWVSVAEADRPQTFQGIGRELLGSRGESIIIVFVAMMQLGICMVFFNFAATELMAVEEYFASENMTVSPLEDPNNGTVGASLQKPELILAATPIALALSLGKSPTIIVVSATIATGIMYVTIGTILFLVFWHFLNSFPGWDDVQFAPLKPTYLPIAFGNLVYTVTTSIGILIPIENSLGPRAKTKYGRIVTAAMLVTLMLDLSVGMLANFAFGPQHRESITAEFIEQGIGYADFIIVINCALALSVLLTYPLQFRPACEVVEAAFGLHVTVDEEGEQTLLLQDGAVKLSRWQTWGYIPVRSVLVFFTAALAAGVPELDLMVSLAGSFTACVLALMIPPAMDFAMMSQAGRWSVGRVLMNVFVIFIGICGLVGGTGATLLQICGIKMADLL
eukprot:m.176981 g.176981  ORF g.176981 m.176981 type:complete len:500 (-) comp14257_c0_seq1:264-1763(-)